ncbi:response regulator [Desulfobacterales bacterium HSG16]|nr:response regulator [Desulfobacterales bacterium HSG16]
MEDLYLKKKLLLVDDEEDIREVLGIYLADMGFDVITAENGEQALDIFRKEKPYIVLSDIKMPGIGGIGLLKKIKAESPDTEVIMITGHGDMDIAVQSLKYEATDFITKPINDDAIEIALKRAHEKISTRQQLREYNKNLQRLVQAELQNTREKYQQLFDQAPCYISVQDRSFTITAINKMFRKDFGEHITKQCYRVYKHRETPCLKCPVEQTFKDGQSHQLESVVTSKSGERYNVLINTSPIKDTSGKITHVMEMLTNITEIRKLQDHLSSLGLLIGSVSHGMKGLLTGLDGGMYLVDSGFAKENKSRIKEGWEVVKLMAGRINRMVLDILYYAKERNLQWEQIDVAEFAKSVASIVKSKTYGRSIEIVNDFAPSLGQFEIDSEIVSSALVNILENGIEACLEDKSKKTHKVIFGVRQDKDYIIFDIRDNGIGMNRETMETIFTLFFSSKGSKGTGLGLFISNKIIEQHEGSIRVDSTPGMGSHFCVRLPKILSESIKK